MGRVDTKRLVPVVRDGLERMGQAYDGGYVVPAAAVASTTCLLSFGLRYDWEFERAFRARNRGASIRCWDHTTTRWGALRHSLASLPMALARPSRSTLREATKIFDYRAFFRDEAVHVRRAIGAGGDTVDDAFATATGTRVFVKMDIEGTEYEVWDDLVRHADTIDAIVVEFHDLDMRAEPFNRCIEAALDRFHVVHVHGNNFGERTDYGFPCIIELTLENKRRFVGEPPRSARTYPVEGLDTPNDPSRSDYELSL